MYVAVLLIVMSFGASVAFAEPYAFPVTPDLPEWPSLTLEERMAALQVPEDMLAGMTTGDIYQTALDAPFNGEYMLSSSGPQQGLDSFLRERYNLFDALFGRDDVADVLARQYLAYRVDETTCHDCTYQQNRSLTELLLSQYEIIDQLSASDKLALVEAAYGVIALGETQPDNCLFSQHAGALIGRIMRADEFPPFMARIADEPDIAFMLELGWGHAACIELAPEYIASANAQ